MSDYKTNNITPDVMDAEEEERKPSFNSFDAKNYLNVKLGKNEERYTDSFNNIASQYNDKQLRIIIKCLPINVRAVLEAECPKYQELVTSQDETEEERIQKERIQEERKIEKEENDKKLQARIEKERREAEKRALKEQKAAEK